MTSDSHLNPPDECEACEEYYAYKGGLCWRCWHEREEELAIARNEQRELERMEDHA